MIKKFGGFKSFAKLGPCKNDFAFDAACNMRTLNTKLTTLSVLLLLAVLRCTQAAAHACLMMLQHLSGVDNKSFYIVNNIAFGIFPLHRQLHADLVSNNYFLNNKILYDSIKQMTGTIKRKLSGASAPLDHSGYYAVVSLHLLITPREFLFPKPTPIPAHLLKFTSSTYSYLL